MTSSALLTSPAETIAVPVIDPTSRTNPRRGGDVRVFDRTDMREVGSPGHPFASTSDLLVTNGLCRYWVCARGLVAHISVSAWAGGTWRALGCLALSQAYPLVGARLVRLSSERAVVALSIRDKGTVTLRIQRGERRIHITHGLRQRPTANTPRSIAWLGTPPPSMLVNASVIPATFANGLSLATGGVATFAWPPAAVAPWTVSLSWKPNAASSTLANAGLAALLDGASATLGSLSWFASDKTLRWTNGATVLSSAPLSFTSGGAVSIQLRQSTIGRTLTVKVGSAAATHVTDSATIATPALLSLGQVGSAYVPGTLGSSSLGSGPLGWSLSGTAVFARGPIDNVGILTSALTDAEAATLSGATTALGGLPQPEGLLNWYAPFDVPPFTPGSPLAQGGAQIYETTVDGGSTPAYYQNLTRSLTTTKAAAKGNGLSLIRTDTSWSATAVISANGDATTDTVGQSFADSSQETTVR